MEDRSILEQLIIQLVLLAIGIMLMYFSAIFFVALVGLILRDLGFIER